jgi:hypothetical protein
LIEQLWLLHCVNSIPSPSSVTYFHHSLRRVCLNPCLPMRGISCRKLKVTNGSKVLALFYLNPIVFSSANTVDMLYSHPDIGFRSIFGKALAVCESQSRFECLCPRPETTRPEHSSETSRRVVGPPTPAGARRLYLFTMSLPYHQQELDETPSLSSTRTALLAER